jgi:hypothetical protein
MLCRLPHPSAGRGSVMEIGATMCQCFCYIRSAQPIPKPGQRRFESIDEQAPTPGTSRSSPRGQTSSSSLASPGTVADVDAASAAHEAKLQAGYRGAMRKTPTPAPIQRPLHRSSRFPKLHAWLVAIREFDAGRFQDGADCGSVVDQPYSLTESCFHPLQLLPKCWR